METLDPLASVRLGTTTNTFDQEGKIVKETLGVRCHCSSGIYIRSLSHDIGQGIGLQSPPSKNYAELDREVLKSLKQSTAIKLKINGIIPFSL